MLYWLNPLNVFRELAGLSVSWLWSRPWRSIYGAVPVLIALLSLVMLIVAWKTLDAGSREAQDRKQIRLALAKQDYSTAKLLQEKWLRHKSRDEVLRLSYAEVLWKQKAYTKSINQLRSLVLSKQNGNAAALLMRYIRLIDLDRLKKTNHYTSELQELVKLSADEYVRTLTLARIAKPHDKFFKELEFHLFQRLGDKENALVLLENLATVDPYYTFRLVNYQLSTGHRERSKRLEVAIPTADMGIKLCQEMKPVNSILYSRFYRLTDRHFESLEVIRNALKGAESEKTSESVDKKKQPFFQQLKFLKQEMALIYLSFAKKPPKDRSPEDWEVFAVLKALDSTENFGPAIRAMLALSMRLLNADADKFEPDVEKLIEASKNPDYRHLIFGTVAAMQKKYDVAESELLAAKDSLPNLSEALNNLAVVLTEKENPDFEASLELSSRAIALAPNHPSLRDTRGRTYLMLKRYYDAINDFDVALKAPQREPAVTLSAHNGIADAYEALGDTKLAEIHRETAKEFSQRTKRTLNK